MTRASMERIDGFLLLVAVFAAAVCGLVYELLAGALSSYLLGDSVTQFSLTIGCFLSAMGAGAYLSRFIVRGLLAWLVGVELAVGVVGGLLPLVGFATFAFTALYEPLLLLQLFAVGTLVGMEVPLVIRILRQQDALRATLANVLTVDYGGALLASLLFPFVLAPHLGLVRAGLVMGLCNVAVAAVVAVRFEPALGVRVRNGLLVFSSMAALLLVGFFIGGRGLSAWLEDTLYDDASASWSWAAVMDWWLRSYSHIPM